MEIIRLFDGRMKITLTKEDLDARGVRIPENGKEDAAEFLRRLLSIVSGSKEEVCRAKDCRATLFPDGKGGCEVFLVINGEKRALPAPARKAGALYLCAFALKEDARRAADALLSLGETCSLFYDEELHRTLLLSTSSEKDELFLLEFGRKMTVDPLPYLLEHFVCLS